MKRNKESRVIKCPFIDGAGNIKSPFRAILDRCILWPTPPPDKGENGIIEIPESIRSNFQDGTAVLLSVGPGYHDKDMVWHPTSDQLKPGVKVLFDNTVPWGAIGKGLDGKEYKLLICGVQDIHGVMV